MLAGGDGDAVVSAGLSAATLARERLSAPRAHGWQFAPTTLMLRGLFAKVLRMEPVKGLARAASATNIDVPVGCVGVR